MHVARSRIKGFSIVEIVLAGATFSLIITALVGALLYGEEATALGGARGRASLLAEEGLEAVRNIADESFSNLVDGTYGLAQSGGQWIFSGASDTNGVFTRAVVVSTIDSKRKSVTSTVTWQQNPSRTGTVQLATRFMNWRAASPHKGGLLAYADRAGPNGPDTIRYRTLTNALTWSPATSSPGALVPDFTTVANSRTRRLDLYSKPGSNEKILITKHVKPAPSPQTDIWAQVWNGSSWGNVVNLASWTSAAGVQPGRDFDGAYLGDGSFLVVYENNTATPHFRSWNGASWSADASTGVTLLTGPSNPEWITVRNRPGTNEAMVAVLDSGNDTNSFYYNGASFPATSRLEHGINNPGAQFEGIGFEWSATTPTLGLLLFNDAADTTANVKTYDTTLGTCTLTPAVCFSASVTQTVAANTHALQLVSRPTATEWLACINNASDDINCYRISSAPAWTTLTNGTITTTTDTGNQRSFSGAFESTSGTRGLVGYSSATSTPRYRTYNPVGSSLSAQSSLTALATALETVRTVADPSISNDILVLLASTNQVLSSVGWDGTNGLIYTTTGLAQTTQGTSVGSNDLDYWFDFAWDQL